MNYFDDTGVINLSGDTFSVTYRLAGTEKEALEKAEDICIEQTVEFLYDLVPSNIKETVLGKIKSFNSNGKDYFEAVISYPVETTAFEFTQLLNVIFGNISLKPGIYVEAVDLPPSLLGCFRGPLFGVEGLRKITGIEKGPLLCTALKPMGLSAEALAELAYHFALGGIDIIKDDHGLTNQPFAPFEERVRLCTSAVRRANKETGYRSVYVANITSSPETMKKRALFVKETGGGGLLIAPGLTGFGAMKEIADDDSIALPVISHPAFYGSFLINPCGISHYAFLGQITRLAGADGVIYPNFGGRFSFTREECKKVVEGARVFMGNIKAIFPCPGGGMGLQKLPELFELYGDDVIYLIGGGLFKHGENLVEKLQIFQEDSREGWLRHGAG